MTEKDRKREPGEIEIDMEDVEIIMGNDITHLDKILNNGIYCRECENSYTGAIENYKIYLNKLDDIIFRGQCTKCKNRVGRYIETGETKLKAEIARHIRAIKKEFKTTVTKK